MRKALLLSLIGSLLLSSSGCVTAERRANRQLNRIAVGMTRDEVEAELGDPDSRAVVEGRETWHYSYGSRPDPEKIATLTGQTLALLTVIGIIFLPLMYAGDRAGGIHPQAPALDGFGPRGDGSTDSETVHFRVVFDQRGRVILVSGIEACDE
jgi:outer membrane protein assembly factor BamE (lipoprotein component of BamABCDE complex)